MRGRAAAGVKNRGNQRGTRLAGRGTDDGVVEGEGHAEAAVTPAQAGIQDFDFAGFCVDKHGFFESTHAPSAPFCLQLVFQQPALKQRNR